MPDFLAKTVHFPLWLAWVPAPQASLAALGISTPGESAGNFRENGSLSPAAGWGTGSTDLSRSTCHFHPRGKCRVFLRKRFTFPRGRQGYRLHRPLLPHLQSLPPGESAGFFHENGSLSPVAGRGAGSTGPSGRTWHFHLPGKCREFRRKRFTFPPWLSGAPALQASLAALGISNPGGSAGLSGENGSLSPRVSVVKIRQREKTSRPRL